jgi:histidinol phosphatase-like PHP family hydrolase
MRDYLRLHSGLGTALSPEELDLLDALVKRALNELCITDHGDRNEVAARVLSLYAIGGRSPDEILEVTIRMQRQGVTPGGRRSEFPQPKRAAGAMRARR